MASGGLTSGPAARAIMRRLKVVALRHPWDQSMQTVRDRHLVDVPRGITTDAPIRVVLTLDQGPHASGWWRNSEFDRCLHLSLSRPRFDRIIIPRADPVGIERAEVQAWADAAFGRHVRWLWHEPANTIPGVTHLRLFLDRDNRPILPTGEVYTLKPWDDGSSPEKVFR